MRDDELQRALKRVDPPAGFAHRVLGRVGRQEPGSPRLRDLRSLRRGRLTAGLAIAATLVIAISGGVWYRAEVRRKEQGEEAKRQVLASLSFAGSKLKSIEMKVNRGEER